MWGINMNWRSGLATIVFIGISGLAHSEVVMDSDDNAATLTGTWTQAKTILGFYGDDYASAQGAGSADTARFFSPRPITTTGTWCIQARWTGGTNRTTAARYQVFDGTTLRSTFIVNQQINGGAWRRLGCVALTAGRIGEVRLTDTGVVATSVVVADGVRWVWDEGSIAQDFCVAVNGGFGSGGTTFVGKGFVAPANGTCKPWSGIMRTATTVVGTSDGAACMSNDAKLLTISLQTTAPEFLGIGTLASDHIELCPNAATLGCPAHAGQSDRGTFGGPAAQIACTTALGTIPSSHD
jgi:hypothetical protein